MNGRTAILGVGLVVLAVVLLIVLSGGEDDGGETTTSGGSVNREARDGYGGQADADKEKPEQEKPKSTQSQVPTIVVDSAGNPVGGVAELTVEAGDEVRFEVRSAVTDHVHVHGYDLMKDVGPGATVGFAFPASIEGIFEAELEERAEPILELRVEP